jgi:hypothetical protein
MSQKPFQDNFFTPRSLLLMGVVVAGLVFVSLLIFGSPEEIVSEDEQLVDVLQAAVEDEEVVEVTKPKVTSKAKKVDDLCEDYSLKQGESLELDGNTLIVDRIGRTGVLLSVNGEEFMISENDDERVDEFLVELAEDDILYFAADDSDNSVLLRLGCKKSSENPNDKYIRQKGESICEQLYETCQSSFDIEE